MSGRAAQTVPIPEKARRRAIIHIGLHKAASTFIQRVAKSRRKIAYVDFRCVNALRQRAFDAAIVRGTLAADQSDADAAAFQARADRDIAKPFLSDERLHAWRSFAHLNPSQGAMKMYRGLVCGELQKLCPEAKIVILTRAPKPWLVSLYKQDIKVGAALGFPDWFEEQAGFLVQGYAVDELWHLYADAFGKDNVLVLPFEWLRDDPHAFSDAFDHFTNLDLRLHESAAGRNESFSDSLSENVRRINEIVDRMAANAEMAPDERFKFKRTLFQFLNNVVTDVPENVQLLESFLPERMLDLSPVSDATPQLLDQIKQTLTLPAFVAYRAEYGAD